MKKNIFIKRLRLENKPTEIVSIDLAHLSKEFSGYGIDEKTVQYTISGEELIIYGECKLSKPITAEDIDKIHIAKRTNKYRY